MMRASGDAPPTALARRKEVALEGSGLFWARSRL
jgi:hypothetical protein